MKNSTILKFSIAFITVFGFTVSNAQVLTNNGQSPLISNSNVLIDGSTNYSTEAGAGPYVGKGIIIPSVDLVNFVFDLTLADGSTFPTFFDGMIVYNNTTGTTLTTGNRSSVATPVVPGFYYFSNPNGTINANVTDGVWKSLGGVSLTGTAPIAVTSGVVSLNDFGITSGKIASNAITTSKIADNAVTTTQIANNAITSAKILDGTITNVDLSATAGITNGQLANNSITINGNSVALGGSTTISASPTNSTLASNNIWVGNAINQATAVVMSGDATMSNTGEVIIASDAITSTKILNETIETADIANNAITSVKLENNIILPGTSSMTLPSGTTAQRPTTAVAGMSRYNTTDSIMEYYNGTAWVRPTVGTTYSGSTSTVLNGTSFERAALTGDVTAAANSNVTTIANNTVTSAKILNGTIISADLSATAGIANGQLANNSITINGTSVELGGSTSITHNSIRGTVTTVTSSSYTLAPNDYAVITNNATGVTITMPDLTPADAGRTVFVFNNNPAPMANMWGGTIPTGVSTLNQYRAMELMWTGTIWVIMGK